MKWVNSLGLAIVLCVVACGCGQGDLRDYESVGPSAELLLPSFGMAHDPYFVVGPEEQPLTVLNLVACYKSQVQECRSSTEGFRMLCALVNRYFGDWKRLVIIERLERGGNVATGFIAVGITRDGFAGVTNLGPEGPDGIQWRATCRLRLFRVDRTKFETCLAELDRARNIVHRPFLWYGMRDWPVYFLHDIKVNDNVNKGAWPMTYFTFAFTGWAMLSKDRLAPLQSTPRDYAKADTVMWKYRPWRAYDEDSEADKELREAGATYASLLSLVWESTLGQPDHGVLGVYPLAPPPAKSASGLEQERGHSGTPTAPGPGSP